MRESWVLIPLALKMENDQSLPNVLPSGIVWQKLGIQFLHNTQWLFVGLNHCLFTSQVNTFFSSSAYVLMPLVEFVLNP